MLWGQGGKSIFWKRADKVFPITCLVIIQSGCHSQISPMNLPLVSWGSLPRLLPRLCSWVSFHDLIWWAILNFILSSLRTGYSELFNFQIFSCSWYRCFPYREFYTKVLCSRELIGRQGTRVVLPGSRCIQASFQGKTQSSSPWSEEFNAKSVRALLLRVRLTCQSEKFKTIIGPGMSRWRDSWMVNTM